MNAINDVIESMSSRSACSRVREGVCVLVCVCLTLFGVSAPAAGQADDERAPTRIDVKVPPLNIDLQEIDVVEDEFAPQPEQKPPDWNKPTPITMGPGGQKLRQWALSAVVIRAEGGTADLKTFVHGSGAIISPDGWMLSNYHVVEPAVQYAALRGQSGRVEVFLPMISEGRIIRRPGSLTATVYRTKPEHDLALLKLDRMPEGVSSLPHYTFAQTVGAGDDCYMIGSPGGSPPWLIRSGTVSNIFEMPGGLVDEMVRSTPSYGLWSRTRARVVVSDCSVSGGDSGGPLLDEDGKLVAITYASPGNVAAGSMTYHIEGEHVRSVAADPPAKPEVAPFDVWTAGNIQILGVQRFQPFIADLDRDGSLDTLVQIFFADLPNAETGRVERVSMAQVLFIDLQQRLGQAGSTQAADPRMTVPAGLWGMAEGHGHFKFDIVVMTREIDRLAVTGFTNRQGVLDEIRIGRVGVDRTDVLWRRGTDGVWTVDTKSGGSMVPPDRLTEAQARRLVGILNASN